MFSAWNIFECARKLSFVHYTITFQLKIHKMRIPNANIRTLVIYARDFERLLIKIYHCFAVLSLSDFNIIRVMSCNYRNWVIGGTGNRRERYFKSIHSMLRYNERRWSWKKYEKIYANLQNEVKDHWLAFTEKQRGPRRRQADIICRFLYLAQGICINTFIAKCLKCHYSTKYYFSHKLFWVRLKNIDIV